MERCQWVIAPKEFKVLCQKAKTFLDTTPGDRLDSKILLIDNWNEWGEGHYVAPCRQYGFGYLDAIREVFTDAPAEHEDLTPEDVGLGPYDNLYKSWETHAKQSSWEFNTDGDVEGWATWGLEDEEVRGGFFRAQSLHRDPQLCRFGINLQADDYGKAVIRMAADKESEGQLFWCTSYMRQFNEPMSIRFKVIGDGNFHEYVLELGKHELWHGRIVGLRFDPVNLADAKIQIDYIRLLK